MFESTGYAFNALLRYRTLESMSAVIHLRAFLSPFGHVAWTAIAAGVLWRVKGAQPLSVNMLVDPRFLKPFCIPVVLRMIWNAPLPSPFWIRHLVLGVVGWFVVFGLVQQGLRQVKTAQAQALAQDLAVASTAQRNPVELDTAQRVAANPMPPPESPPPRGRPR